MSRPSSLNSRKCDQRDCKEEVGKLNETGLGFFLYETILDEFPPCQPNNISEQRMKEHELNYQFLGCPFIITDKFHKTASPIYHSLGSCEYKKLKWFEELTNMLNFLLSLGDKSESELAEIPQGSVDAFLRGRHAQYRP